MDIRNALAKIVPFLQWRENTSEKLYQFAGIDPVNGSVEFVLYKFHPYKKGVPNKSVTDTFKVAILSDYGAFVIYGLHGDSRFQFKNLAQLFTHMKTLQYEVLRSNEEVVYLDSEVELENPPNTLLFIFRKKITGGKFSIVFTPSSWEYKLYRDLELEYPIAVSSAATLEGALTEFGYVWQDR